jgi:hypothetical protein
MRTGRKERSSTHNVAVSVKITRRKIFRNGGLKIISIFLSAYPRAAMA